MTIAIAEPTTRYPVTEARPRRVVADVPVAFDDIKSVHVESDSGFHVSLDGKSVNAKSLEVKHTKPLRVYDVKGMRTATYIGETGVAEIELAPGKSGGLAVTSPEKDPIQERLAKTTGTGVTEYCDPRTVVVDGRVYHDLDIVEVSCLADGKARLLME